MLNHQSGRAVERNKQATWTLGIAGVIAFACWMAWAVRRVEEIGNSTTERIACAAGAPILTVIVMAGTRLVTWKVNSPWLRFLILATAIPLGLAASALLVIAGLFAP